MSFGSILIMAILALFFSSAFNDYKKGSRTIDLFIVVLSATGMLMMFVNYLIICMKG